MRDLLKAFSSLSNETRLRILRMLMERECCVCEIMQALDISQTRASRNLGVLQNAGLVKSRREGLWVIYSIDEESVKRYRADLLEIIKGVLRGNELIALDLERLRKARRVGKTRAERNKKGLA